MSAYGDEVLAMARSQIGVSEQPPYSNNVPYWDWYGASLGSWCACFVSWCYWHANHKICAVDSEKGFVLVSNGTIHSYETPPEAQATAELEPGDTVLFSWYAWSWSNGLPVISDGSEWDGWIAGDHTGIFAYWIDRGSGQFACVEGNTGDAGSVMERTDRYMSQVCGWWRPPTIAGGAPSPGPTPIDEDDDMYQPLLVITEGSPWKGSVFLCSGGYAVGIGDESILKNMQARGYCKPTIEVNDWDVYGAYMVVYPSGPGAIPR